MTAALDDAGLVYELLEEGDDGPTVVAFPGRSVADDGIRAIATAQVPGRRVVLVDPPRRLYDGRDVVGRRWYVDNIDGTIDPASFADALVAGERLVEAVAAEWGPPTLLGQGQGGELALALAVLMPERLSAVVAVDAGIPDVPGWTRATRRADGLPVRLLGAHPRAGMEHDVQHLQSLGAAVVLDGQQGTSRVPKG